MLRYFKDPPANAKIHLAQTITYCQLCDKNAIRWKCVDCSDLFCDDCKKIHERGKATRKHKIVGVKDVNEEVLENSCLNLDCARHHFVCTMFCATCNQCTCANCVTDNHSGHTFQDLKTLLDKKRKEIKTAINNMESDAIPKLEAELNAVPVYFREFEQMTTGLKNEIEKRGFELKNAVDVIMKHHTAELSRFSNVQKENFVVHETVMKRQLRDMQDTLPQLKRFVQPTNISEVASLLNTQSPLNHNPQIFKNFGKVEFIPGNIRPSDIQREFGYMNLTNSPPSNVNDIGNDNERNNVPDSIPYCEPRSLPRDENVAIDNHSLPNDHELRSFGTSLVSVTSICLAPFDKVWVGCANTRRLEIIDEKGQNSDLPPVLTNVLGFSIGSDGDLFLTDIENCKVRRRTQSSGKLTLVKEFKPKFPISIHVDIREQPNIVYVGLVDSVDMLREEYELVTGGVVRMSTSGEILKTFGNSHKLTVPNRLTINQHSKNVLVIDSLSLDTGRVIALSRDDILEFTYNPSRNHEPNAFNPSDFVCARSGLIVICDGGNGILHVLDPNGVLRQLVDTKPRGIERPWSLALYKDRDLYIGTYIYKGGKQTKENQKGVVYKTNISLD